MSDILSYLAEPETVVVFDIDGVLAPYEFGELSHAACLDGDWKTYVLEEHPYAHIRPVPQIQRFIEKKGRTRVFACSVAEDYEEEGKRDFVVANYGLPADHVKLVRSKSDKVAELRALAKEFCASERRVALVEDTVKTLDEVARKTGCTTVHVSSFFFA
jgi:hypothetical protein